MMLKFKNESWARSCAHIAVGIGSAALLLTFAGCGVGPAATPQSVANATFAGVVHGGQNPVSFGHVALFATTSTGYNGTLTPLATTESDANGNFQFTTSYTCPGDQQAYVVASGGNPGLSVPVDNSAIFLVAALGPCANVKSSFIVINEVTTVAAAYALSGFAPAGGAGMTETAVVAGTPMPGITTSSTNPKGLADAFANAANIVDISHGTAYTSTPTTSANGIVPLNTINALGDILQGCVNEDTASSCSSLFTAATPPAGTGISAPQNVFQAALNIAQYPANHVPDLFNLISAFAAFPTTLAQPNDWTLGITYTAPLLVSASGLGIDANDNVYVTGKTYLIDFSPQGEPLTTSNLAPTVTSGHTLRYIAFDLFGNAFITDDSATGIYEYQPTSSTATFLSYNTAPANTTSPTAVINANTYGITVDGLGDVFTSSYSKATCGTVGCNLFEFPSSATTTPTAYPAYTPFSSFSSFAVPQPTGALGGARSIAYDVKTNNIWYTAIDDNLAGLFKVTPSTSGVATATAGPTTITDLGTEAGTPATNTAYGTISVAVDATSNAWFVVSGGPATTGKSATATIPAALYPVSSAGTLGSAVTGGGMDAPTQVIVDGNNNLFVANGSTSATDSAIVEYSPALGAFLSASPGFIPSSTGVLYEPQYLEVDRAGALWIASSGSGSSTSKPANLIQILGVAAPVNPVQAAGQYGVKP
jgi:hypothetical protein